MQKPRHTARHRTPAACHSATAFAARAWDVGALRVCRGRVRVWNTRASHVHTRRNPNWLIFEPRRRRGLGQLGAPAHVLHHHLASSVACAYCRDIPCAWRAHRTYLGPPGDHARNRDVTFTACTSPLRHSLKHLGDTHNPGTRTPLCFATRTHTCERSTGNPAGHTRSLGR